MYIVMKVFLYVSCSSPDMKVQNENEKDPKTLVKNHSTMRILQGETGSNMDSGVICLGDTKANGPPCLVCYCS